MGMVILVYTKTPPSRNLNLQSTGLWLLTLDGSIFYHSNCHQKFVKPGEFVKEIQHLHQLYWSHFCRPQPWKAMVGGTLWLAKNVQMIRRTFWINLLPSVLLSLFAMFLITLCILLFERNQVWTSNEWSICEAWWCGLLLRREITSRKRHHPPPKVNLPMQSSHQI